MLSVQLQVDPLRMRRLVFSRGKKIPPEPKAEEVFLERPK
jgi:hypothetical protein